MKKEVLLLLVLLLPLKTEMYSQNKPLGTDILAPKSFFDKGSDQIDKGRVVQNGIHFLKSEYGKDEAKSESSSEPIWENQKLWRTFEFTVEKSGEYYFAAHIMPVNNVEKLKKTPNSKKDDIDIIDVSVYVNDKLFGTLNQTKLS